MVTTSLFLCHNVDPTEQKETQVLDQLYLRLQDEGAKITDYPGSPAEEDFQPFFQQHLPRCQWFVLFQTPEIVSLPTVRQAVNTALKLAERHQIEGVVRFIAIPSAPQDVPPEWSGLPTYDATYDFDRATEKLLLRLSGEESNNEAALFTRPPMSMSAPTISAPRLPVSRSAPRLPVARSAPTAPLPFPASANTPAMPLDFDRPPAPPSSMARFGKSMRNGYQDMLYERKRLVVILSILLILTLLGTGLGLYFTRPVARAKPNPVPPVPTYGQLYFLSTNMALVQATTHTMDAVTINLKNLKQPANGNSYYAWLLPDVSSENGSTILVSQFTPQDGAAQLKYQSPIERNLLATESRFLITEESTSPMPEAPTADQSRWRYYGTFPQMPSSADSSHFSALDHARHLLVSGPMSMMAMNSPELPGGLGVWLLQNVHFIFERASEIRGSDTSATPLQIVASCVQILDLLDGKDFVAHDVPQNTPWLAGPTIANKPLLTLDPNAMIPGYIHDIEAHLLGFASSPGVTQSQQTLAGQLDVELNEVQQTLMQVHDIAKQLAAMNAQQLGDPSIIPQLDTLANASMDAYAGRLDPTTGTRQGGVIAVYDHVQQLAQFPVYQYPPR
jgi:hypothetical protein